MRCSLPRRPRQIGRGRPNRASKPHGRSSCQPDGRRATSLFMTEAASSSSTGSPSAAACARASTHRSRISLVQAWSAGQSNGGAMHLSPAGTKALTRCAPKGRSGALCLRRRGMFISSSSREQLAQPASTSSSRYRYQDTDLMASTLFAAALASAVLPSHGCSAPLLPHGSAVRCRSRHRMARALPALQLHRRPASCPRYPRRPSDQPHAPPPQNPAARTVADLQRLLAQRPRAPIRPFFSPERSSR